LILVGAAATAVVVAVVLGLAELADVDSSILIGVLSLVVALALGLPALYVGALQTHLARRQTILAERASQPNLWIRPSYFDDETGSPIGADHVNSFGLSVDVGNDGGATARGVKAAAFIGGKLVFENSREYILRPHEVAEAVGLYLPPQYVVGVKGRGIPEFTEALSVRAQAENAATVWWPPEEAAGLDD
jgi:hypothetical protein